MITLIHHPEGEKRLGDLLVENLQKGGWKTFRAAAAFVKRSGVKHLAKPLKSFTAHGVSKILAGIDQGVTSAEGLTDLLAAVQPNGEVWVFHNEAPTNPTFHPKVYLFSNDKSAECFIGSGNLTEGGLFTNYEAFVHLRLDRSKPDDKKFLDHLETLLDNWSTPANGTALKLTPETIEELKASGDLPTESEINARNQSQETPTMKKKQPCARKDEVERFRSAFGKCLKVATETRRVRPWPPDGRKFKIFHLCANCAKKFDDAKSEAISEGLIS